MGKKKGGSSGTRQRNDARNNGKAPKKRPKVFSQEKRRLITK